MYIQWQKFHTQVVTVHLQRFRRNSVLKCASQLVFAKKFTKTPYFWVQGHSTSSMLTFLRSPSPVLVVISSMSVPIWKHFYARRANTGKITFLEEVFLFLPLVRGDLLDLAAWNFVPKYLKFLSHLGLERYWDVPPGRTDGRTDWQTHIQTELP